MCWEDYSLEQGSSSKLEFEDTGLFFKLRVNRDSQVLEEVGAKK
jgi:hypothetical protein